MEFEVGEFCATRTLCMEKWTLKLRMIEFLSLVDSSACTADWNDVKKYLRWNLPYRVVVRYAYDYSIRDANYAKIIISCMWSGCSCDEWKDHQYKKYISRYENFFNFPCDGFVMKGDIGEYYRYEMLCCW